MEYIKLSEFAFEDTKRSHYIFNEIFKSQNTKNNVKKTNTVIPEHIIQYWDDEKIPGDVQKVMDSWSATNIQKTIFNQKSALRFIEENFEHSYVSAFQRCLHPAMRADYFRLCYLYLNGGIYIDADNKYEKNIIKSFLKDYHLKIHPLCYDLSSDSMLDINQYFYDTTSDKNRIYYVNNDPIITPPKHNVIKIALNIATQNLLTNDYIKTDFQAVAGPGVLSMSLVQHHIDSKLNNEDFDVYILTNWDIVSTPQWHLEYRKDQRDWRKWTGKGM